MITPGICSLTLKTLPPEALIRFAADSGLRAIEWWAAGHVPPANSPKATPRPSPRRRRHID